MEQQVYYIFDCHGWQTQLRSENPNLCRKIGSGASQMAALYQDVKQQAHQAVNIIDELNFAVYRYYY